MAYAEQAGCGIGLGRLVSCRLQEFVLLRGPPPNGFVVILSHLFPSHFGNVVKQGVIVSGPHGCGCVVGRARNGGVPFHP